MNDPKLRERVEKLLDREVEYKPMPEHDPSPVRSKPWTPRVVEEGEREHCDPLDYLQRTIDNPQMSHRDKVFAASNLAPYVHPKRTGQYVSNVINIPPPQNAAEAKNQIALVSHHVRLGYATVEEGNALISHLEAFIRAEGVTELAPRIAALEQAAAARGDTIVNQVALSIESSLPRLPGNEQLIMPNQQQIEAAANERGDAAQSPSETREDNSPAGIEDLDPRGFER
jgi:hypothetical protein